MKSIGIWQASVESQATDGTQLMRPGAQGEAHYRHEIELILRHSWRRSETEVLQEGGEEEEDLHPGETLPQTCPST